MQPVGHEMGFAEKGSTRYIQEPFLHTHLWVCAFGVVPAGHACAHTPRMPTPATVVDDR